MIHDLISRTVIKSEKLGKGSYLGTTFLETLLAGHPTLKIHASMAALNLFC